MFGRRVLGISIAGCLAALAGAVAFFALDGRSVLSPARIKSSWFRGARESNRIGPSGLRQETAIGRWFLLGPFNFSERDVSGANPSANHGGLNHDFLADLGHTEGQLTSAALSALCANHETCRLQEQHGAILNLDKLFPEQTYAVVYAVAGIASAIDGDVGLEYDFSTGSKVWLNGQLLQETPADSRRPVFKYAHFQPLHLRKGSNILVVKADQLEAGRAIEPWAVVATLMPMPQMREAMLSTQEGYLLRSRFLKPGESPYMPLLDDKGMLDRTIPLQISIEDWSGAAVMERNVDARATGEVRTPPMQDGYYTFTLRTAGHVISDAFYVGDPGKLYDDLRRVQGTAKRGSAEYRQRDPILIRYRVLTSDQYSHPADPNWQKKLLLALLEGVRSIHFPKEAAWCHMPGPHLREFVSRIDGTPQFYLFTVPKGAQGPLPIVIIMPYAVPVQRPFLESAPISYSGVLEFIRRAADQSGLGVAVIHGRGTVGDAPAGEADAFEVLNDIAADFPVDPGRLYLYGVCEGGRRALMLAEHYPGVFAAMGAWGPKLGESEGQASSERASPFSLIDRLASTPVVLLKGEFDEGLRTEDLLAFGKALRDRGDEAATEIIPDAMHDPIRMEPLIFPRLARHRNAKAVASVADLANAAIARVPR